MTTTKQPAQTIIGYQVSTSYETVAQDMGLLWQKAMDPNFVQQIPGADPTALYVIYTNYASNYTGAYDAIIGYPVETVEAVPEGMVAIALSEGAYATYLAEGNLQASVPSIWQDIWAAEANLQRAYQADYEVYTNKNGDPNQKQAHIYVGLKG